MLELVTRKGRSKLRHGKCMHISTYRLSRVYAYVYIWDEWSDIKRLPSTDLISILFVVPAASLYADDACLRYQMEEYILSAGLTAAHTGAVGCQVKSSSSVFFVDSVFD